LDELDIHLGNDSLHIVAAPGSGKTVLGLEVMRRLGNPALILSPTITIRNQWQQRLCAMFLPAGTAEPDWLSLDIKAPKTVTASTYQALHDRLQRHLCRALGGIEDDARGILARDRSILAGPPDRVHIVTAGRLTLLQARTKALSAAFRAIDRVSRWQ